MTEKEYFIKGYVAMYHSTKKKAMEVYRAADKTYISAIIDAFKSNAKRGFYYD